MTRLAAACALALLAATPVAAHRLDEYLQATTIELEKGRVHAEMRLVPGVEVFPIVFAAIDRNADGVASAAEHREYAERLLNDVSLTIDGRRVPLRVVSSIAGATELLQAGRGEILVRFEGDVPGTAARRALTFENRHRSGISVYLVNGLVPRDSDIQLLTQERSYDQAFYRLDYTDASAPVRAASFSSWLEPWRWADGALLALIVGLALLGRHVRAARGRRDPYGRRSRGTPVARPRH
jgi:hypothetical protein